MHMEAWMAYTIALARRDTACQLWSELAFIAQQNDYLGSSKVNALPH